MMNHCELLDMDIILTTYIMQEPPFIENKTKVIFLVELNTELLMTKYENDLVKSPDVQETS